MDFRINLGPWETIFAGQTYGHEVEIISNPENFFLVFIYDKKDGRKVGAVVEGYKAFYAKGQMEAFIQTLPKPSFGVEKSMGDKTSKIFFLSFDPFYLDFKQDGFIRRIDIAVQKIDETAGTIVDLARASSLELKELGTVAKTDYAPVLGDPFVIKSLIAGQQVTDLSRVETGKKEYPSENQEVMIQLGMSKAREIIMESVENLKRTQIVGSGLPMFYTMYILLENFLLEDIPVVVFDSTDYFDGIGISSPDTFSLKEDLVDFEPMGFPMRKLVAKGSIRIALKNTDLFFLFDLLGMNDPEFQKNISLLSVALRADTPDQLIQKIFETKDMTDYDKLKAERVLMIVQERFGDLFGGETPASELTKTIPGKIGRAVILDMKDLKVEEKIIFMHTLLRQLIRSASQTEQLRCSVMIPEAPLLFAQSPEKAATVLERLENRGIGVVIGMNEEAAGDLDKTFTAKMSVVTGKDVAVSIKSKRNYRVILRPSLSGKPKYE